MDIPEIQKSKTSGILKSCMHVHMKVCIYVLSIYLKLYLRMCVSDFSCPGNTNVCVRLSLSGGIQYMFTLCNVCTVIGDGRGQHAGSNGALLHAFLSCEAGFVTSVCL